MKKIITIGVSGSIAAYKIVELVEKLKKNKSGIDFQKINLVLTNSCQSIFGSELFSLENVELFTSQFEKEVPWKNYLNNKKPINHIQIADSSDLILIAPATANIIGKLAHGIYDDLLTTIVCATEKPVVLAPAMNVKMWQNPIVQENVEKLKKLGVEVLEPEIGNLACGYQGQGRLPKVDFLLEKIIDKLTFTDKFKNRKILVTSGGTTEKIDEVRVLTNLSSGKMGVAIANECFQNGALVKVIRSKNSTKPLFSIPFEEFYSSDDLTDLIKKNIRNFDIIFHLAAVSDFSVQGNFQKLDSKKNQTLKLVPQPKILAELKKWNPDIFVVSFKAENWKKSTIKVIDKAIKNIQKGYSDLVVVNKIGGENTAFGSDYSTGFIVDKNGILLEFENQSKINLAKKIINLI